MKCPNFWVFLLLKDSLMSPMCHAIQVLVVVLFLVLCIKLGGVTLDGEEYK